MTLKLFTFVRRASGVSPGAFRDQWSDWHERWVAGDPELRRHVARCELNARLGLDKPSSDRDDDPARGFDGVEVLWFESLEALEALQSSRQWAAALADASFRDGASISAITHEPDVIIDDAPRADAAVKLVCILRHHAALNLATFHRHWLDHHGGLFRDNPELRKFVAAYDQNHGLVTPGLEFDGVTEQWFASLDTFGQFIGCAANRDEVEPDVADFLDPTSMHFILAGPPTVIVG